MTQRNKQKTRQLVCSECGAALTGRQKYTCSERCRKARSDRRIRENKARAKKIAESKRLPEHLKTVSESVAREAQDVGKQILQEELRPVVREAITAEVLEGIAGLVRLTPRMVELIGQDLESTDPAIRQKAYTLLARYTLGNASVAPAGAEAQPAPMQVQFLMPRPGDPADAAPAPVPVPAVVEAEELRECVECQTEKPPSEFVGASPRCQACHADLMGLVDARFGTDGD